MRRSGCSGSRPRATPSRASARTSCTARFTTARPNSADAFRPGPDRSMESTEGSRRRAGSAARSLALAIEPAAYYRRRIGLCCGALDGGGVLAADQVDDGLLDEGLHLRLVVALPPELLQGAGDGPAGAVPVEDPGVDVRGPAHGRRV